MRTIALASNAVSGKATELSPLSGSAMPTPRCPVELPPFLLDKDFRYYKGYYHTDYTIPSDYFLPDIKRPNHQTKPAHWSLPIDSTQTSKMGTT